MAAAVTALILAVLTVMTSSTSGQEEIYGYRIPNEPTYMIVAPRKVYPNMIVQVQITIFKLFHEHITVRGSIRKEGEEHAAFLETFFSPSTKLVQMQMLPNSQPGNYTLKVEGTLRDGSGNIFTNETDLIFEQKQVSIFITTNKPLYHQGQKVLFRIIPVQPNLMAVYGSMDIYILDPSGTRVRRWLAQQTNAGILNMEVQLADQPSYGEWKIHVRAFGYNYNKSFHVEEFFLPRFYVNVSMPEYVMEDTFGIAGLISANHTSGRPVRGNGTLHIEMRLAPGTNFTKDKRPRRVVVEDREISFFEGRTDFLITLRELAEALGEKPTNYEVHVNVSIFDWFLLQNQSGYGVCVIHERLVRMKLLGDRSRTFKPGFPYSVYWALVEADGSPLHGQRRQVTINRIVRRTGVTPVSREQKHIVRDDGIVQYDFVAEDHAETITVRAEYDTQGQASEEVVMTRVYTYFNTYIQVSTSTEQPRVNEYMIFTVRTNTWVDRIYYLIVSKGNIIIGNTLEMHAMQKSFSVALSRDMVPTARLVAYFLHHGELVADGLNFFVNGTDLNPVDVLVNMGKDFSRNTVEISGRTDPGSFIAFSGNDYELYSKGGDTFITEKEVIEELDTYDAHANSSYKHTWFFGENHYQNVYYPSPSYGVDSNTTFSYAGLLLFTDANVTRLPHDCNITLGYLPCNDRSCYSLAQQCDSVRQCSDGIDEMGCPKKEVEMFTPRFERFKHLPRHFVEDAGWLWMGHFTKPDGRVDLRADVPKEPMSWVVSAVAMSRDKGLGFVTHPARHQSTREFYIQVEMPSHSRRGEQLGVRIEVFNYWLVDIECLVTLHDSPDYRVVVVDDDKFGVVSSYAPTTRRGDFQTMVFIEASRMATIYFPVLPVRRGDLQVTVSATSFMGTDMVTRNLSVEMDGVTNYNNTPYLIDLINQGSIIIPDFDTDIPEQFWLPEQRQHLYVPGSAKAKISVVGDVVGPSFFLPYLTAENVMRKPYGCGEQSAFNFAINLYYLKFLKQTDQLEPRTLQNALHYMNLAFQRVLSYMNPKDASFSMFRDYREPKPSTWLTAFVLRLLQYADEADWRETLYIPVNLVNRIATWLHKQQDPATGVFLDKAPIYDAKNNETLTEKDGVVVNSNVSLTAHVLIGLAGARGLTGEASTLVDAARTRAIGYLEQFVSNLTDPYQTALVTYALTVANSNKRNKAFEKLRMMNRTGEYTYWSRRVIPPNPFEIINTVPINKPRVIYPYEASAVEATGYALLVYLQNNRISEAVSIMKWLQSMRNSIGGFSSTRDTIVALQALTAYGARDTNRGLYNMEVTLEHADTNFRQVVSLDGDNWAKLQEFELPGNRIFGYVKAKAKGTGIALIQLHTQVNVEYRKFIAPRPVGRWFDIVVDELNFSGKNKSIMQMSVCSSWQRPDVSPRSGMAVIEVGIPTGYIIVNDILRLYVQSGAVPTLSRAEFYSQKVVFYLDYLEAMKRTCIDFRADRWYPVANGTIQQTLKVYDYYEPGRHNTTLYTTYDLFTLHICQVCASFQCPYCPFYNGAPAAVPAPPAALLLMGALYAFLFAAARWTHRRGLNDVFWL